MLNLFMKAYLRLREGWGFGGGRVTSCRFGGGGLFSICMVLVWLGWGGMAVLVGAEELVAVNETEEGAKLARQLRNTPPAQELDMSGKLNIRDATGAVREVPFTFKGTITPTNWLTIYRAHASGGNVPATQTVAVMHSADVPNSYWHLPQGSGENWQPLEGKDARTSFAGSDFALTDLGLEFLHWPQQKVMKKEMRKSRACTVLESRAPQGDASGYAKVLSWVDNVSGGILVAEAYDDKGKMLKEFTVNSLKKVEGNYQVQQMEMRTLPEKTRTRLDFELKEKERSSP